MFLREGVDTPMHTMGKKVCLDTICMSHVSHILLHKSIVGVHINALYYS